MLNQNCDQIGMTGREKDTSDDDVALWQLAMRDVEPLPKPKVEATQLPPKKLPKAAPKAHVPMPVPVAAAHTTPAPARDLDRRTQQKLERGQMAIDAVLDLHGMTQEEAYGALNSFVLRGYHAGLRCVLVITGKGRAGAGVLKARLPDWLDAPALRPAVLRTVPAQQKHGGGGAFYVLLRRSRG